MILFFGVLVFSCLSAILELTCDFYACVQITADVYSEMSTLLLKDGLNVLPNGGSVKAALLGLSADMSALRKVAQFLGHKADLGCSRCTFKAEREPGNQGR